MNRAEKQRMEEEHLVRFMRVRRRLLALRAFWGQPERAGKAATRMIARLEEGLGVNAYLIAFTEQRLSDMAGENPAQS